MLFCAECAPIESVICDFFLLKLIHNQGCIAIFELNPFGYKFLQSAAKLKHSIYILASLYLVLNLQYSLQTVIHTGLN
jgi:hypothetical protein